MQLMKSIITTTECLLFFRDETNKIITTAVFDKVSACSILEMHMHPDQTVKHWAANKVLTSKLPKCSNKRVQFFGVKASDYIYQCILKLERMTDMLRHHAPHLHQNFQLFHIPKGDPQSDGLFIYHAQQWQVANFHSKHDGALLLEQHGNQRDLRDNVLHLKQSTLPMHANHNPTEILCGDIAQRIAHVVFTRLHLVGRAA